MIHISKFDRLSVLYGNGIDFHKKFKPFKEAREFVKKLGLETIKNWGEYCKSGSKPNDIPSGPEDVYKDKGWIGFGDWLGNGKKYNRIKNIFSYNEAKQIVLVMKFDSSTDYLLYCSSNKKHPRLSPYPDMVYKNKGWKGWKDFLGFGFLSYEDAKKEMSKMGFKNRMEFRFFCNSGKRPTNIPSGPDVVYKNNGWRGWEDWIGK